MIVQEGKGKKLACQIGTSLSVAGSTPKPLDGPVRFRLSCRSREEEKRRRKGKVHTYYVLILEVGIFTQYYVARIPSED